MAEPFLPPTDPRRRAERGLARVSARRQPPERTKASTLDSRIHNRALVLATLYHQGAMSRSELARTLGLTAPTVSALIAELEADGLVVDTGPRKGGRLGKPASVMRIDEDAAHILTLDLSGSEYFSGAVLNLRGDVVRRARVRYGDIVGEPAIELVFELVGELMDLAPRRILGIGVGSPGIVGDAGVIHHAAHLGWSELPLAAQLSERFGVPPMSATT